MQIGAKVPALLRFCCLHLQGSPFDYPEDEDSEPIRNAGNFVIILL